MTIGCDLDGVLADWNSSFIRLVKEHTKRDLFGPSFAPRTWNYAEDAGYTTEEVRQVWNVIKGSRTFWAGLEPYYDEKVVQALDLLHHKQAHGDEVYFITSRPGYCAKEQSESWLEHHGMGRPTVLISSDKGGCAAALKLDAYLDDNLENVMGVRVMRPQCQTFLCDRPWNRGIDSRIESLWAIPGVLRCASVYDFVHAL